MLSNQQVIDTKCPQCGWMPGYHEDACPRQPLPSGYEELVEKLLEPSGPNQARRNLYEQLAVEAIRTLEAKLAEVERERDKLLLQFGKYLPEQRP